MFFQRLCGLINTHAVLTTSMLLLILLGYANLVPYLPLVSLSNNLDLAPYMLCILAGMFFNMRYLQRFMGSFYELSWVKAGLLTSQELLAIAFAFFAFMFAFKDGNMSRLFLGSYLIFCWIFLFLLNWWLPRLLSHFFFKKGHGVRTLVVGSLAELAKQKNWLHSKEVVGFQNVGYLATGEPAKVATDPPCLGQASDLAEQILKNDIGQVILLENPRTDVEGRQIIKTCRNCGCRLLIYSNLAEQLKYPLVMHTEEERLYYSLQDEPLQNPLNRFLKRSCDLVLSIMVVGIILLPLALIVWLMQRRQSPGKLFCVQERAGYATRSFRMYKFRTMHDVPCAATAEGQQCHKADERVYHFGRILRKYSLDEIPQFLNVLAGQMSAIGPRPHLPVHDELFMKQVQAYRTRFYVKPGVTGLAQSNGYRGEIKHPHLLQARIKHDLEYIVGWSLWLDLKITTRTVKQIVFPPSSAY